MPLDSDIPSVHSDRRGLRGAFAFGALLIAAFALLGELGGSLGDPDRFFHAYFDDAAHRATSIAGSAALCVAGLTFLVFVSAVRRAVEPQEAQDHGSPLLAIGIAFAGMLVIGAACLAAVGIILVYAELFDEAGTLESGRALLPQLGLVLLMGANLLAAAFTVVAAVSAHRGGRWSLRLVVFSYGMTPLIVLSAFAFIPLPLVVWVGVVAWCSLR